jgi:hypothetical protein
MLAILSRWLQGKAMNERQNESVAQEVSEQEAIKLRNTTAVCKFMEAGGHRQLILSQKDLETILQLAQAPPQPPPKLIVGLRKAKKIRL